MKYNLANTHEATAAVEYLLKLTKENKVAEIISVSPKRSLPQNAYLHLLIGAFGLATGNNMQDSKDLYKYINKDLYYGKKKIGDQAYITVRSSADLDKEEMAKSIDHFMEWSKEHGYPLPPATNQEWLRQVENDIERNRYLL